jgi:Flp pilus assembly protein TadG
MNKRNTRGQSLIEFALVIPLLFLLVVNVVNFGALFYAWITVSHAARSAAQLLITGPAYAGYGATEGLQAVATPAQIQAVLTNCSATDSDGNPRPAGDLCSLPNRSSITVAVCTNNMASGTATPQAPETCLPPNDPVTGATFADPEPATSVVATVEVRYRYCPLIPFWEFPALGIHSTLPSCPSNDAGGVPIRRVAVMRMIQ